MTHWFFSPHSDDAALSCGGQIATLTREGVRCVIITVMAGDPPPDIVVTPFIVDHWARWRLGTGAAVTEARRAEDRDAAQSLGAEIIFLDYPEALYRGYEGLANLFGTPKMEDMLTLFADLTDKITHKSFARVRLTDTVHLPLGVGEHADHLIVGAAGVAFRRVRDVRYYVDYPYSRQPERVADSVTKRMHAPGRTAQEIVIAVDEEALRTKIEAVACFRSQINSFWPDNAAMAEGLRQDMQMNGGEREWTLTPASIKESEHDRISTD